MSHYKAHSPFLMFIFRPDSCSLIPALLWLCCPLLASNVLQNVRILIRGLLCLLLYNEETVIYFCGTLYLGFVLTYTVGSDFVPCSLLWGNLIMYLINVVALWRLFQKKKKSKIFTNIWLVLHQHWFWLWYGHVGLQFPSVPSDYIRSYDPVTCPHNNTVLIITQSSWP